MVVELLSVDGRVGLLPFSSQYGMFDLAMITDHLPQLIASDAELWQDICVVNATFPIYTCGSEAWFTASNPM